MRDTCGVGALTGASRLWDWFRARGSLDLPLKDAVKETWLYGNAARVLGIE